MQIAVIITVSLALLFQQVTAYQTGIPQDPRICTLKTDHGDSKPPPDGDFTIKIWKNGEEKTCFTPNISQTFQVKVTNSKYNILGILMAVEKSSIRNKDTCLPDGVTENNNKNLCPGVRLYHQVRKLYAKELIFQFTPKTKKCFTIRTTVVFSYRESIEDKRITFCPCHTSTPIPTPTPIPTSTIKTTTTPTVPPTPVPCANPTCNGTTSRLRCPRNVSKAVDTKIWKSKDNITYNCTSNSLFKHFTYVETCTQDVVCGDDCEKNTFNITCSLNQWERNRKYNCVPTDPRKPNRIEKFPVNIERGVNCVASLSDLEISSEQ